MDTSHTRIATIGRQAGFDACLVKPVTHAQLMEGVSEAMAKRRGQAVPQQTELRFPTYASLDGARLLVAEDNLLNQTVAKGLLEQFGAQVTLVNDGAQAVAQLQHNPRGWDAILLDVQMPVMDGYTACQQLLALGITTPIIAMTAGVMAGERERCKTVGMAGFIAKPIEVTEMLRIITQVLPSRLSCAPTPLALTENSDALFYPERLLNYMDCASTQAQTIYYTIESLLSAGLAPFTAIAHALDQGQFAAASKLLHSQKGSLGNLGATLMYRHVCQLEELLHLHQLHTAHPSWQAATAMMAQTLAAAEAWLQRHPPTPPASVAPTHLLTADLTQLKHYLRDNDLKALEFYENVKFQLGCELTAKTSHQLTQAINQLDFAQAILCLDEIA